MTEGGRAAKVMGIPVCPHCDHILVDGWCPFRGCIKGGEERAELLKRAKEEAADKP